MSLLTSAPTIIWLAIGLLNAEGTPVPFLCDYTGGEERISCWAISCPFHLSHDPCCCAKADCLSLSMKTFCFWSSLLLLLAFCGPALRAATVNATGSGNWDSTTPDAPWPLGVVPAATDSAVIGSGFTVTVVSA